MGCDIHAHVEVKIDGIWEHWGQPNAVRWYALFEKMAGVRGEVKNAIAPPRGIPADVSKLTNLHYLYWGSDAHSASWLNRHELEELGKWITDNSSQHYRCLGTEFGWFFGNDITELRPEFEDVRLVFWFDN